MPVEVAIESLGRHGDGLATSPDGTALHVARALPGERVRGEPVAGRIDAPTIVVPSADRVAPPCPHFRRCGACALQHASDATVAAWKVARVRSALARAGLEAEIAVLHTSPPGTRRRAALSGRKTKRGAVVGFHLRGGDAIEAIPGCRVLDPRIVAALPALEAATRIGAPRGAEIALHVTATETGLDLSVSGARALDAAATGSLAGLGFARITWLGERAVQHAAPEIALGPARVVPPPGAFLQATPQGEAALATVVAAAIGDASRVVDLFAGAGTFTFRAAMRAPVHAVEGDRAALDALAGGARRTSGLKPITTEARDLFREPLTAEELARFDAAILDPPRAGAAAQVAEIARSTLRRLAHLSCNPETFARDAATLVAAGWRMGPVTVVDQFRWSAHIEVAAPMWRD